MSILITFLDIYSMVIIASALISWFPLSRDNPIVVALNNLTEPVYAPIRAILDPSKTGGIDVSPILVLLGISLLKRFLISSMMGPTF